MAVDLTPDIQHWTMHHAVQEKDRPSSRAPSMDSNYSQEGIRISPPEADAKSKLEGKQPSIFDDRYMSSEEALSPCQRELDSSDTESFSELAEDEFDDDDDFYQTSVRSYDLAIIVSIIPVGRPKIVDVPLPSPISTFSRSHPPSRTSSLQKEQQAEPKPVRRPPPLETRISVSSEYTSPAIDSPRPSSVIDEWPSSKRFSITSLTKLPLTPKRHSNQPVTPTKFDFLNHDPMEVDESSKKDSPLQRHFSRSRLRGFSRSINIARRALGSNKKGDSKDVDDMTVDERPATPITSAFSKSRFAQKMVPRGANEREPTIELPPFPDEDLVDCQEARVESFQSPPRRRKSITLLGMG